MTLQSTFSQTRYVERLADATVAIVELQRAFKAVDDELDEHPTAMSAFNRTPLNLSLARAERDIQRRLGQDQWAQIILAYNS